MSNEIKTRRLIVTLPNIAAEEIDEIAAHVEDVLSGNLSGTFAISDTTVTHALGETLPTGFNVTKFGAFVRLAQGRTARDITAHEARQLAGVLLAHAHDIDPNPEA